MLLLVLPSVIHRYTPNTWLIGDGGFYLNMQKSIAWYGTLDQSHVHPRSWFEGHSLSDDFSNVSLGRRGEWWPKHGYVMPIVALPFYATMGVFGSLVFNVGAVVLMIALAFLLARATGAAPVAAAATALGVGATGPFTDYAYNFSNDGFYTVLILGGLLALAHGKAGLAGVLAGVAVWTKITCVLMAPAFLGVLWWQAGDVRRFARGLGLLIIGAAGPIVLYGLCNWFMFGSPWVTAYQRVLVVKDGLKTVASHTDLFTEPFKDGLKKIVFESDRALATTYALSFLCWLGVLPMLAHRRERGLALGVLVTAAVFVGFFAKFKFYQDRFLFPYFTLAVVPGAHLVGWAARALDRASGLRIPRQALAWGVGLALALTALSALWSRRTFRFSERLEGARVYLGGTRCDYFNNMRWSWECPGGRDDGDMLGRNANQKHAFGGVELPDLVTAHAHPTMRTRRVVFPAVALTDRLRVRFGHDDESPPTARTELRVLIDGEVVLHAAVDSRGTLYETVLDTSAWRSAPRDVAWELVPVGRDRGRLAFDGWTER